MQVDLIIRNARVVTSQETFEGDIAVHHGLFEAVGEVSSGLSAVNELDAGGKLLLPGLIDTQVHFREPGLTHKETIATGTLAAITGGVTAVLEMPNTNPTTSTEEALQEKLEIAKRTAYCDIAFFVGATTTNIAELAKLENLPGTPGVKIFMGSSTGSLLVENDEDLLQVLKNGQYPCAVHAEDEPRLRQRKAYLGAKPEPMDHPFLRDAEAANRATVRLLALAIEAGRPVHVLHISTAEETYTLAAAKAAGQAVTCEVTPQHLFFAGPACYEQLGSLAQMNPPVRSESHRKRIWEAFDQGLFDVFGSDHAPHLLSEKEAAYPASPSGMPGVQTSLNILGKFVQEGRLSFNKIVDMFCETPAQLYRMTARGKVLPGYKADFILVDPDAKVTLEDSLMNSKCGWTPYRGVEALAFPQQVFLSGSLVAENGKPVAPASGGIIAFSKG